LSWKELKWALRRYGDLLLTQESGTFDDRAIFMYQEIENVINDKLDYYKFNMETAIKNIHLAYGQIKTLTNGCRFRLNKERSKIFEVWKLQHDSQCPALRSTIDGRFTFSFTPNSLGCMVDVQCQCGAIKRLDKGNE